MARVPRPAGSPASPHRPVRALALLALAELGAVSLWFSATAVLPALQAAWDLSPTGAAWLTAAVQAGFVVGALASAVLSLPDAVPPRRLMAWLSPSPAPPRTSGSRGACPRWRRRSSCASSPASAWPASTRRR